MSLAAEPRGRPQHQHVTDSVAFAVDRVRIVRPGEILSITVPAPRIDPLAALAALGQDYSLSWSPHEGIEYAAGGVAALVEARGPTRFADVRDRARAVFDRQRDFRHPAVEAPPLRMFGGFAFDCGGADLEPWAPYGDASFTLPAWCYARSASAAWLTISSLADASSAWRSRFVGTVEDALAVLAVRPSLPPIVVPASLSLDEQDHETWAEYVATIRSGIFSGQLAKVVAARRTVVELAREIEPWSLLARLAHGHPNCYRFGFHRAGRTFVGAPPERLIAKTADIVRTEALAGSIASDAEAAALMASQKDRREQAFVVDAIREALAPLCSSLEVPAAPHIRRLRHVLHLQTSITGRLDSDVHVLDLVDALHPTPAVGGVPTTAALRCIAAVESQPRGWYAGPVGWFDRSGDGEFAVAIRSGLVRGRHAFVYAGAGIVRDSDPAKEYDETGLKQRALLDALGVDA